MYISTEVHILVFSFNWPLIPQKPDFSQVASWISAVKAVPKSKQHSLYIDFKSVDPTQWPDSTHEGHITSRTFLL